MKKYWGIHSLMISLTLLFAWTVFADQQPKQDLGSTQKALELLIQATETSGAKVEQIQLHYGGAHASYQRVEEVKQFAESLGAELGLIPQQSSSDYRFQRLELNVLTELQVMAMPAHSGSEGWDSYLTIKLSADPKDLTSLQEQLSRVYKALESVQIMPQFNTCVQGIYSDTLENDVQLKRMNKLLDLLGAEVVEKVEDPTVKSFSAYTKKLPFYILTKGNPMNVQAGMHVDQTYGITRLTIGTPIITIEY